MLRDDEAVAVAVADEPAVDFATPDFARRAASGQARGPRSFDLAQDKPVTRVELRGRRRLSRLRCDRARVAARGEQIAAAGDGDDLLGGLQTLQRFFQFFMLAAAQVEPLGELAQAQRIRRHTEQPEHVSVERFLAMTHTGFTIADSRGSSDAG